MGKILVYIVVVPVFLLLLYRFITLYEYDTKQRYLKDMLDSIAQKVKITGVLTQEDYEELKGKLNKISRFEEEGTNTDAEKGIRLMKCKVYEGEPSEFVRYIPGENLDKGDIFAVSIKSSEVSNFSRIHNSGVNPDDTKNLYYKAKAECRVEYVP